MTQYQTAADPGDENGRPYFDVTFSPVFSTDDGAQTYTTTCRASLQLDEHTRLPPTEPYSYWIYNIEKEWNQHNKELSIWDDEPVEQNATPSTEG